MLNSWDKIRSTIPCEQNLMAWLVKNEKTVFNKFLQQVPLSVSAKEASKLLASSFPFSNFYIFSSLSGCYFSEISCTLHFGQMFNGFLTSTFDLSYDGVWTNDFHVSQEDSPEGKFLFAVASGELL